MFQTKFLSHCCLRGNVKALPWLGTAVCYCKGHHTDSHFHEHNKQTKRANTLSTLIQNTRKKDLFPLFSSSLFFFFLSEQCVHCCFINVLFNLLWIWILLQNAGSQLCFRFLWPWNRIMAIDNGMTVRWGYFYEHLSTTTKSKKKKPIPRSLQKKEACQLVLCWIHMITVC